MLLSVQDEIFDMVKPADPLHLTLQDLITRYCTQAAAAIHLLLLCHVYHNLLAGKVCMATDVTILPPP